jgi:hypothetical protein
VKLDAESRNRHGPKQFVERSTTDIAIDVAYHSRIQATRARIVDPEKIFRIRDSADYAILRMLASRRAWRRTGMDENAAAVIRVIYGTARCLECIAARTEQPTTDVSAIIEMIERTMYVGTPTERCGDCGASSAVFRIGLTPPS